MKNTWNHLHIVLGIFQISEPSGIVLFDKCCRSRCSIEKLFRFKTPELSSPVLYSGWTINGLLSTNLSCSKLKATSGTVRSHILWENNAFVFGHDNMVQVWQTDLKLWIWSCPNLEDAISIPTTAISNHEDAASLLSSAVNEAFACSMESLDSLEEWNTLAVWNITM